MSSGIYLLRFPNTNKVYVGQAKDIGKRFNEHLRLFSKGEHSKKLNEACISYGIPVLEVLLECPVDDLNYNENLAIEIFNSVDEGFNSLYRAEDTFTEGMPGDTNSGAKYSNHQIIDVFYLLLTKRDLTLIEISELSGVSVHVVRQISQGSRHKWLADSFPKKYLELMSLKGTRNVRPPSLRNKIYPPIVSPLGDTYIVTNISEFARLHLLEVSSLTNVLNRKNISHKGWKLQKLN